MGELSKPKTKEMGRPIMGMKTKKAKFLRILITIGQASDTFNKVVFKRLLFSFI